MLTLRFYEELNDFLPPERRKRAFAVPFELPRSVKDLIESVGVPHVEVDLILVNGESVGFDRLTADGDYISVYPVFERLDIASVTRLRPEPLRRPRFIADVHLKTLARKLRMLGFDTVYDPALDDPELADRSTAGERILLTRDIGLLKRGAVIRGLFVRAADPEEQLVELVERLDLLGKSAPFSRCIACNGELETLSAEELPPDPAVPPDIRAAGSPLSRCRRCGRSYWRGSHYDRMREEIDRLRDRIGRRTD